VAGPQPTDISGGYKMM